MRYVLLFIHCCLLGILSAKAQDNIYLRNGKALEVRIKKVSGNLIYYTAPEGGPQRYLRKSAVEKIVYKSGREVMVPDPAVRTAGHGHAFVARHMLTIAPLHLISMGNLGGVGIGLDYEQYLGARSVISVHLPVYIGFGTDRSLEKTDQNSPFSEIIPFYTAPGIRFHPVKPGKRVDYAVGVSVLLGTVNQTIYYENTNTPGPNVDKQFLLTGATLDNDLNLSKRKFIFGIHTAAGPVFGDFAKDGKWFVQLGFKLGWKF